MNARPTTAEVQRACADHFDVLVSEILGPRRTPTVTRARWTAMHLCHKHLRMSCGEIGMRFGDRDHTTVLHALRLFRAGDAMQDAAAIEAQLGLCAPPNDALPAPITLVPDGYFTTYDHWVNKARSWLKGGAACFDQRGRLCTVGAHFMRARDEDSFPVAYFLKKD